MEIVNFGLFKPELREGLVFFTNEEGQDWYEMRRGLTEWGPRGEFISAVYGAWLQVEPDTMIVTNVEYDPSRLMPGNRIVLGVDADWQDIKVGQVYRDGQVVDPPPPTIEERRAAMRPLTPREFRDALIDNDILPDQVTAALKQMPDEKSRAKALNSWEYPLSFVRTDPLVDQIGKALGLSPERIDAMWISASGG